METISLLCLTLINPYENILLSCYEHTMTRIFLKKTLNMLWFVTWKVHKTVPTLRERVITQSLYFGIYGNILSLSFVVNVSIGFGLPSSFFMQ